MVTMTSTVIGHLALLCVVGMLLVSATYCRNRYHLFSTLDTGLPENRVIASYGTRFLPVRRYLSAVQLIAMVRCPSLCVSLSQVDVLSKGLSGPRWFFT